MMMGYFKPWRRKFGVVTPGLACVFAAVWLRIPTVEDMLTFVADTAVYRIRVLPDELYLTKANRMFHDLDGTTGWNFFPRVSDPDLPDFHYFPGELVVFRVESMTSKFRTTIMSLTLLSTWLLLSKPRQPKASTPEQITPS